MKAARKYRVEEYDNPKRFLVLKPDDTAYLVELDYFGQGKHACFCRWFECHTWNKPLRAISIPHCRHIREVEEFLRLREHRAQPAAA